MTRSRKPDLCHYVTPFGSPVTMPRAHAERLLRADMALYCALRDIDSAGGLRAPYIEG